jgi:hypothetical protein
MRKSNWMVASVLSCGVILSAGAASAFEGIADQSGCVQLAQQVNAALASNPQSANYADAQKEKNMGRDFCTNSMYGRGMAHYQQALNLLGASKS